MNSVVHQNIKFNRQVD